jgi:hypothetical protein
VDCIPSNTRPEARIPTGKIRAWFADDQPFCVQIKHPMKTSLQTIAMHPALFQIAARIEAPITPRVSKSASSLDPKICITLGIRADKSSPTKKMKNATERHRSLPQ